MSSERFACHPGNTRCPELRPRTPRTRGVPGCFQEKRAGVMFKIYDTKVAGSRKVIMVNGPTIDGWAPVSKGSTCRGTFARSLSAIRSSSCSCMTSVRPADPPPQHGLVQHHVDPRWSRVRAREDFLAFQPHLHPAVDLSRRAALPASPDDRAGISGRLQEPRHNFRLVRTNGRRLGLNRDQVAVFARDDISWVGLPPPAIVGAARHFGQPVPVCLILDAVCVEELAQVRGGDPGGDPELAGLDAGNSRSLPAELLGYVADRMSRLVAQTSQLSGKPPSAKARRCGHSPVPSVLWCKYPSNALRQGGKVHHDSTRWHDWPRALRFDLDRTP